MSNQNKCKHCGKCGKCGKKFCWCKEEKSKGITKEYQSVYKILDKWTRDTFKDADEPLSDLVFAIEKVFTDKKQ